MAAGDTNVAPSYPLSWLPRDIIAGLVLTTMLVPVGIAYAEAAGLPGIYGLYATIVPLLTYALFGPSRIFVLGPDSALAPGILIAVVAAMVVVTVLDIETRMGLAVLGPLPQGLPAPAVPLIQFDDLGPVIVGGIAVALGWPSPTRACCPGLTRRACSARSIRTRSRWAWV